MIKYNDLIRYNVKSNTLYNAIKADAVADDNKEHALEIIQVLIKNNMDVDIQAIKYIYDFYINHIR